MGDLFSDDGFTKEETIAWNRAIHGPSPAESLAEEKTKKSSKPKKKASKKKLKDGAYFELKGKVLFVERKNGKIVSKEEIDGKLVLTLLVHALEKGLDLAVAKKK